MKTCILSHGRSGTLYTMLLLNAAGMDFGHEADGKDGSVGGVFWMGTRDLYLYDLILHQIRNPLDTIASLGTCRSSSITKTLRETGYAHKQPHSLRRMMLSWYRYTLWAESLAKYTYCIEDIEYEWPILCEMIGVKPQKMPRIPTNTNTRKHGTIGWEHLYDEDANLAEAINKKAWEYGYDI